MILINVLGLKHTETETHGWVKSASRKNHYVLRWAFDDVLSPVHISLVGSRFVSIPSPTSIHSFIHSFTFANISSLCLALLMSLLVAVETDRERERERSYSLPLHTKTRILSSESILKEETRMEIMLLLLLLLSYCITHEHTLRII